VAASVFTIINWTYPAGTTQQYLQGDRAAGSDTQRLEPGQHPFGALYALKRYSMLIEAAIYLNALLREFPVINRLIVAEEDGPAERRYSFPVGILLGR
jgi:hypothetical protein